MRTLLVIFLMISQVEATECWNRYLVKEHTQVFTVNLLNPELETESKKIIIHIKCDQAKKIKINDNIQIDRKTMKFNKLPPYGMMMKKTYTILERL